MAMLPVKEAESVILSLVQPFDKQLDVEVVDLTDATGRILACSMTSQLDFPHWDNSAMDGYAVRYADVQSCNADAPVVLEIVEEIPAGKEPQYSVQQGQASRILTGACMPIGADTVVMQERTRREQNRVFILEAPEPQGFVRHRGSFYRAGMELLTPGTILNAPEIAVLAAAQCTKLPVYRRPHVAILSTGDELVTPDQPLQPGQIVDSNQYALAALVTQMGGIPQRLGIIPDEPEALKTGIAQAISCADIVLSTGGVSVGDYDYVDQILAQLGAEIHIRSVAMRPGKPLTVATFPPLSDTELAGAKRPVLYFGLPGNPVSALVSCWRFVQPTLRKLSGWPQQFWEPVFVKARSRHDLRSDGKRETYIWGQLHLVDGTYEFQLASGSHSSGNLINLAKTNSLAVVPIDKTLIPEGEQVQVLQVSSTLSN
jgi:molybdopterin molybdotransferase